MTFFEGYQRFSGILDHPPRVLDTTQIIDELKAQVRPDIYSRGVIGTSSSKRSYLVAATHVYEEMYRSDRLGFPDKFHKLASQAEREGWPTDQGDFKRTFETEYLPRITFVEMGDLFLDHPVVQSVGNVSDVPTAQLAVLLACDMPVVLSTDSHLRRPGLAPSDLGTVYLAAARMETSELSVYASAYVSTAAVQQVNVGVKRAAEYLDIPPALAWTGLVIVLGIVAYFALKTPERREAVGKTLSPVVGFYGEIYKGGEEAKETLAQLSMPRPSPPSLAQRVAKVFIDHDYPISMASIHASLHSYLGDPPPTEDDVLTTLVDLPCFTTEDGEHWRLGKILLPPD
jgi:hypothetical protein